MPGVVASLPRARASSRQLTAINRRKRNWIGHFFQMESERKSKMHYSICTEDWRMDIENGKSDINAKQIKTKRNEWRAPRTFLVICIKLYQSQIKISYVVV